MGIISGGKIIEGAIPRDAVTTTIVAGAAAGDITITGIKTRDTLSSVLFVDFQDATDAGSDLTSEFSISAANTINNAGGTASTGGHLVVTYLSVG